MFRLSLLHQGEFLLTSANMEASYLMRHSNIGAEVGLKYGPNIPWLVNYKA